MRMQGSAPLNLHLQFYIRDAVADAGKCPAQLGITQMWMKNFGGGVGTPCISSIYAGSMLSTKDNHL